MACSILRLRAAAAASGCRQFASSAVGLMLPSNKMYSLGEKKVVNINKKVEKEFESDWVVGSSHGWVGLTKEEEVRVRPGSRSGVSLWNPMSGSHLELPPLHPLRVWPGFTLRIRKLIVDDAECSRAVMNVYPVYQGGSWMGVCSLGGGCSEWTLFGGRDDDRYCRDVVAAGSSKLYSLDAEELVEWDISEARKPRMSWKKDLVELGYGCDGDYAHLVYAQHSGQLFLVKRRLVNLMDPHGASLDADEWNSGLYPYKTVGFDVYLVDNDNAAGKKARCIKQSHSLDGLVMFVGLNSGFAVAAADFPHLNPDSIYFTDHVSCIYPRWWEPPLYQGHDVGIYDYKNKTISSCYFPSQHQALKRIHPHPFWFTPTSTTKD